MSVLVHHHELDIPPGLRVTNVNDIVIAHDARSRELSIFIYPVTDIPPERWVYRMTSDGPALEISYGQVVVGDHRCWRVVSTHPAFRRVIVFVETSDGSEGWLPIVLVAKDDRHDPIVEALAASVRPTRTHPFQMWID